MDQKEKPLILLVDDEPKSIQYLGNLLRFRGYRISYATSGEKALSILEVVSPDLILLDVILPDYNGFDLCKKIKADKKLSDIPVLFLTGQSKLEEKMKGFQVGGSDYITKPFEEDEIIARVKTHLDLKKSINELVLLNATKNKFFSIIAHDLKNPFSSISGFTQLMETEYEDLTEDEKKLFINEISKTAKNTNSLLDKLLQWATLQTGQFNYSPEKLNLKKTILNSANIIAASAKIKNIDINVEVNEDQYIFNDSVLIETLFRNLLSNAVKFSNQKSDINVISEKDQSNVKISVIDYGVGLTSEDLSNLFRIDVKTTKIGNHIEKGPGLGLIICKEILQVCNGSIDVVSNPGKGSTFSVIFPI